MGWALAEENKHISLQSLRKSFLKQLAIVPVDDFLIFWRYFHFFPSIFDSYLRIQEDDSLLCDEEVNACALVPPPLLDFLSLGSEHVTPDNNDIHDYSKQRTQHVFYSHWKHTPQTFPEAKTWEFTWFFWTWKNILQLQFKCDFTGWKVQTSSLVGSSIFKNKKK